MVRLLRVPTYLPLCVDSDRFVPGAGGGFGSFGENSLQRRPPA